ncbi:MAG: GerMN domain-containing protein [Actinobacteria bacterium]|nr:GerMN domain-containing protein [Actinomycetota bacterium]
MRSKAWMVMVLVMVLAVLVVANSGCDKSESGTDTVKQEKTESDSGTDNRTDEQPPDEKTTVEVFFLKGESLISYARQVEGGARGALDELLEGLSENEKAQGAETAVPEGVRVVSYTVKGNTAKIDFSRELLDYGGGSAMVDAIITQITRTVLENDPDVHFVEITVEGVPSNECMQP